MQETFIRLKNYLELTCRREKKHGPNENRVQPQGIGFDIAGRGNRASIDTALGRVLEGVKGVKFSSPKNWGRQGRRMIRIKERFGWEDAIK